MRMYLRKLSHVFNSLSFQRAKIRCDFTISQVHVTCERLTEQISTRILEESVALIAQDESSGLYLVDGKTTSRKGPIDEVTPGLSAQRKVPNRKLCL